MQFGNQLNCVNCCYMYMYTVPVGHYHYILALWLLMEVLCNLLQHIPLSC